MEDSALFRWTPIKSFRGIALDHRGHEESPGCFRCHAGDHVTATGETITADCRVCHTILAWDETSVDLPELMRTQGRRAATATPASR